MKFRGITTPPLHLIASTLFSTGVRTALCTGILKDEALMCPEKGISFMFKVRQIPACN